MNRITKQSSRKKRHKHARKRKLLLLILSSFILLVLSFEIWKVFSFFKSSKPIKVQDTVPIGEESPIEEILEEPVKREVKEEILMSFAGDCTLGTDSKFSYDNSFPAMFQKQNKDYSYFFKNVYDIFSKDDYTLVNLENPLTEASTKADKGSGTVFHFKGPKDYVNILTSSSIEGVTIANNHMNDYGSEGLKDTVETLSNAKVDFCGKSYKIEKEIKGTNFLFLGYEGWSDNKDLKNKISEDIRIGKEKNAIIIPYFHWGIEGAYEPYDVQINLARFSIDEGAHMVLGSHPHVIQSLENYNNKLIVYSFGNFSFGGNFNPSDKRTFILQTKLKTTNGEVESTEFKVIPTSISSVDYKNDYAPTPYTGEKKTNLLQKFNNLSPSLKGRITDEFFSLE